MASELYFNMMLKPTVLKHDKFDGSFILAKELKLYSEVLHVFSGIRIICKKLKTEETDIVL